MLCEQYAGKKIGILGAARSGLALGQALVAAGAASPVFWDDTPKGRQQAEDHGFTVKDMTNPEFWHINNLDLLSVSPGIAHLYPVMHPAIALAMTHNIPVDNDISLYLYHSKAMHIAVTGSNGKSTTSALIQHIFQHAKRNAQLGGNIGMAVFNLPPTDYAILELSSYQTDLARYLKTDTSVFLNLSDDHLDRHNGRGGYFAAKERLIHETGFAVIGIDEPEGLFLANRYRDKTCIISTQRKLRRNIPSVFMEGTDIVVWNMIEETHRFDLHGANGLKGQHNHQNACAAVAVALHTGLTTHEIQAGLKNYKSLAHRMEEIAVINGITFVNDSKATNADATAKALAAFENIHWIAGGTPKEGGIASLTSYFSRIKKSYLIGKAAQDFAKILQQENNPFTIEHTLEYAVQAAFAEAKADDVILLSPACASFDQFDSFEHRGDTFRQIVGIMQKQVAAL